MRKSFSSSSWPRRGALALAFGFAGGLSARAFAAPNPRPATREHDMDERVARLERALADTQRQLQTVQDVQAIEKLQRIYGYYLDKAQWDQVPRLFTEDCEIEIGGGGVFVGPGSWEKLRYASPQGGAQGLEDGALFNHMILQGVVDVSEGGLEANGRWRCVLQLARWGKWAAESEGLYENVYRKVDGRWLIHKMVYAQTFTADSALGYAKDNGAGVPRPARLPGPPDKPSTIPDARAWPQTYLLPYHYGNPGRPGA